MKKIKLSFLQRPKIDWRLIFVTCTCALCFVSPWFLLLVFAEIVIFRLFSGKVKLKPGDVLYCFGLPGAGKTMFMAKCAEDNRSDMQIYCNDEMKHYKNTQGVFTRDDLSTYTFPPASLLLFDEASLTGFDNRDYKTNFDPENLYFLKKIRQYGCCIVFSNHSPDELDKKIRDGLVNTVYYVENKGFYSRATRIDKDMFISDVDGQISMCNVFPTFWERLFDPSCVVYYSHKKYGKLYQTVNVRPRPYLPFYDNK